MIDHVSDIEEGKGFVTVTPVKCVSDGSEEVVCDECGKTFTRTISAHDYAEVSEKTATCTLAAQVTSRCKDCGAEKTESKGEAKGHTFDVSRERRVEPTCVKDGSVTSICSVCGYTEKKAIPATGHDESAAKYYSATIDKYGKITLGTELTGANAYVPGKTSCEYAIVKVTECQNGTSCNIKVDENGKRTIVTVIAQQKAHSIDTTESVVTGIFLCNDEGKITINKVNGNVVGLTNATIDCTHAEAQVFTCATCGKLQYNIITPKAEHTRLATGTSVLPTCDEDGYTTYSCSTCHKTIKDTVLPALGHDYVYDAPYCGTGTAEGVRCTRGDSQLTVQDIKDLKADDVDLYNEIVNLLISNDVIANENGLAGLTSFRGVPLHTFSTTGTFTKADGLTYRHCTVCDKDIVVSPSFAEEPDGVEFNGTPTPGSNDAKVVDRMKEVSIKRTNNVITITQNAEFTTDNGYISGSHDDDCIGIMLNLGVAATSISVESSDPAGYTINKGVDDKKENMINWGASRDEADNCFIIWLNLNEDFKTKDTVSITFKSSDSTTPEPITITFKLVKNYTPATPAA